MSLNSFRNGFQRVLSSKVGFVIVFIFAALLVFSFVYSGLNNNIGAGRGGAASGGSDETIAKVNSDPITRAEYEQGVERFQQQAQEFGQNISVLRSAQLHDTAIDELVTAKLELQEAKRLGLTASDADIAKARAQAVAQSGITDKLGLKSNASIDDINAALAKAGAPSLSALPGLSDEALSENILLDKLQTIQANKVVVTEQDAKDSFQQWHTRHILIDNKKRSDVQAQSQANQILAKAKAPGANFAALAAQYSEDPGTKAKGGDDGWIDQNTQYTPGTPFVPEFKQAVFALKPGEITLVKTPEFGYFIIQLVGVRSNLPKDFAKNPAQYIAQVKQQKQQQAKQDFINGLKNDPGNKIVIDDPELRADRALVAAATESDPAKQQADYRSALADYQKALAAKPAATTAGEIDAQIAQAYEGLHQTPQAITAFQAAAGATDDADVDAALGDLYRQSGQTQNALTQYAAASKQAWDDPQIHSQLLQDYQQMKQPSLVASELDWQKQYQARQKQSQAASTPITTMPQQAAPTPQPAAPTPQPAAPTPKPGATQSVQVVPSPAPGAATVRPASAGTSTPGKKPAQ